MTAPESADPLEGATGRGVRVGVVDSGWDRGQPHPRVLSGMGILGIDGPGGTLRLGDDHDRIGHGTAVADLVLRTAPEAEVVPVRVFDTHLETSPAVLAAGIRWAADAGVHVLNLSLGTREDAGVRTLYAACEYARRRGVVVVAACAQDGVSSPAIFDNAISVGVLPGNSTSRVIYRQGEAVECLANPVHAEVLWRDGARVVVSGTSFAAPIVAGTVARLRELHPGADLDAVRAILARHRAPPAATSVDRPAEPADARQSEERTPPP